MKKNMKISALMIITLLSLGFAVGCSADKTALTVETTQKTIESSTTSPANPQADSSAPGYGAAGATLDKDLTMEEMLIYSIQDEYLAHSEYEYIIETFGAQNPFSNIIKSEETHISELKLIFDKYKLQVPTDLSKNHLIVPPSVKESLETSVQVEIENIAMYENFLEQELPEDVQNLFNFLMKASESHLSAFQKNLNKQ